MRKEAALNISIRAVTKRYGDFCALENIGLEINAGEFMTLLGPSGSGKTTLLMVLAGFTRPDSGVVQFGDEAVIVTPPHKRGIGMVFQNYALFPHMDVEANIAYPLKLRGLDKADMRTRVEAALQTVKLDGLGDRRVSQLSGGQRQRVALARAIVFTPKILLMDEPLSALDKKLREEMQIELRELHDSLHMTTVYVTHDQKEALTMSDRIAVINNGQLMQLGTPNEIYRHPANAFIADFIGESSLLPVSVSGGKAHFGAVPITLNHTPEPVNHQLLVIRPEKLFLASGDERAANHFSGTVISSIFQGESQLLLVKVSAGTATPKAGAAEPLVHMRLANAANTEAMIPAVGDSVTLGLHQSDSFLVR